MPKTIPLPNEQILMGRDAGGRFRKEINLNELDITNERISFLISLKTLSFNSSFFIGCFLNSIRTLGRSRFENKYRFLSENLCMQTMVFAGIERCERLLLLEEKNNVTNTNKLP